MTTTDDLDTAGAVLELARARRRAAEDAERDVLVAAAQWAAMHSTDSLAAAAWHAAPGCEEDVAIAGEGAPHVAEFAVADFAAALGVSTDAGRRYLGQAIELRHRLPRTWTPPTRSTSRPLSPRPHGSSPAWAAPSRSAYAARSRSARSPAGT